MPNKVAPDLDSTPGLEALVEVVRMLREPGGCPWDIEQTHATLVSHMLEEAYEAVAAIQNEDQENMCEEFGDVLLQVVLHAQIASEDGRFDLQDIAKGIAEKLIRRHPHVFADDQADDVDAVLKNWEAIKVEEKGHSKPKGMLHGVGEGLPSLMRAQKIQKKAAKVGFDWPDLDGVRAKIDEELAEVEEARESGDQAHLESEIGDLLLAVTNLARRSGVDAESALAGANDRFTKRFGLVEEGVLADGGDWATENIDQLEERWQEAKRELASGGGQ